MPDTSSGAVTASQKFEEEARRWKETGEVGWCGLNEYGYTKLRFWMASKGAEADGISDVLWEYGETVEQMLLDRKQPGWFGSFMETRDYCSICGETFNLDNLSFCTHCECLFGYCHQFGGKTAANGNPECPRCKVGEIVWGEDDGPPTIEFKVRRLTAEDLWKEEW